MTASLLSDILRCPRLPTPPASALKILDLARQSNANLTEITRVIKADPALTMKLLRTVNSSFYGTGIPASTIDQAVVRLGLNTLMTLALSFGLVETNRADHTSDFDIDRFWRRSVYAAVAARIVSKRGAHGLPEIAFLAALLQDIGVLALLQHQPATYAPLLTCTSHRGLRFAEQKQLGIDHTQVGEALARHWKLPQLLVEPIRWHEEFPSAPLEFQQLVRVIALANDAADVLLEEDPATSASFFESAEFLLSMDPVDASQLLKEIAAAAKELLTLFNLPPAPQRNAGDILAEANELLAEISLRGHQEAADLRDQHNQLTHAARTDPLTNLANRRAFDQFATGRFGVVRHSPLSLIMVDLDHFKSVNDRHGHAAGDEVLRATSRVLATDLPLDAIAARLGGEEFALLLCSTNLVDAARYAEQLRQNIEAMVVQVGVQSLRITASFGVASTGASGNFGRFEALAEAADQALYKAKANGRNQVCCAELSTQGRGTSADVASNKVIVSSIAV